MEVGSGSEVDSGAKTGSSVFEDAGVAAGAPQAKVTMRIISAAERKKKLRGEKCL